MRRIILLAFILIFLFGCGATSRITAFKDPAYSSKQFKSIAVFAQGMSLAAAVEVENQVCRNLYPTPCVSGKSILPPTRQYTSEEVYKYLTHSLIDGVLFIALVEDRSETRYFGSITNTTAQGFAKTSGTINFFGNSAFWSSNTHGSAYSQSISTPIYSHSRLAFGQLGLFERKSGNIVWRGEIQVEGKGLYNVTDEAFIESATAQIAYELKTARLVK